MSRTYKNYPHSWYDYDFVEFDDGTWRRVITPEYRIRKKIWRQASHPGWYSAPSWYVRMYCTTKFRRATSRALMMLTKGCDPEGIVYPRFRHHAFWDWF